MFSEDLTDGARRRAERKSAAEILKDELARRIPRCPRSGPEPGPGLVPRHKADAFLEPYIEVNGDCQKAVIVVDADHNDVFRWRDAGVPRPNWVVVNRRTGKHHLGWLLESPVSHGIHSRTAPIRLMDHLRRILTVACGGDPRYVNRVTRNPIAPGHDCDAYILSATPTSLSELYEDVSSTVEAAAGKMPKPLSPRTVMSATDGRNCGIFDEVRQIAYACRGRHSNRGDLEREVLALCHARNTYAEPLGFGEIRSIARSIAKWTWKHIGPNFQTREMRETVASRPPEYAGLSTGERRAAMCSRCWKVRTRHLVMNVVAILTARPGTSVAELAEELGVSRPTIYRIRGSATRVLRGEAKVEDEHPDIANPSGPTARRRHARRQPRGREPRGRVLTGMPGARRRCRHPGSRRGADPGP